MISFGSAWAKSDGIVEPSNGQGVGAPPNATSPEIPGSPPESETGKTEEPKQPTAPGAGAAPEAPSSSAAAGQAEENRQKEAEEARRATELYLRNQNVFLRKGELMVEANTFYNRNSRQDFVSTTAGLAVARITSRFFDNTAIARYGILTDGLEFDVIAPLYVHAERETDFGGFRDQQTSDGVGDLALALRYQAWYERGARPSVIFDVDWKSRTGGNSLRGTGAYSVGYGVTLLKSLDPVVFFARGGYVYNIARDNYDLGNIFEYRLGMGFSLNDRVSFNIQVAGALVGSSQITATATSTPGLPGAVFVGSRRIEIMNLYFTTTVVVTKNFFIEPVVGIAMTDTAFTTIGIRMPFRMFSK